jgi:hypothetical protein
MWLKVADLVRMESLVLQTLDFRVSRPNAHTMLSLFRKALDLGPRDAAFAMYIVVSLPPTVCGVGQQGALSTTQSLRRTSCRRFSSCSTDGFDCHNISSLLIVFRLSETVKYPLPPFAHKSWRPKSSSGVVVLVQELSVLEYGMLEFQPSVIAAAAILLVQVPHPF